MKKLLLIVVLLLPCLLFADKIKDPIKYYLNHYGKEFDDDRKLLKMEFDLNNDGVKEIFLSYSKTRGYENLWIFF